MRAPVIGVHAVGHLLGAEQACRLNDGALAMDPFRLNRVEPGALDWQTTHQETHAEALPLDGAVVRANPGTYRVTDMPGGVVPDQDPDRNAQGRQLTAAPGQKLRGDRASTPNSVTQPLP